MPFTVKGKWFLFFLHGSIYCLSNLHLLSVFFLAIGTPPLKVLNFLNSIFRCLFFSLHCAGRRCDYCRGYELNWEVIYVKCINSSI